MHDLPMTLNGLIRFDDVRAAGREAELTAALAAREVERLRRGIYVPVAVSDPTVSDAEQDAMRYANAVRAAAETLRHPVFTSFSALALAGLPIFGRWPSDIYVMSRDQQGHRRPGVVSVAGSHAPRITAEGGCAVTSLEFTLIQLCRNATLAAALTATDAALHEPRFGSRRPRTTLGALRAEHERLLPYRGSRRTEAVLTRATVEADTPLETLSRLAIEELGFEEPELQHELWLPELGKRAYLDFFWQSVGAGGEADGRGKYLGAGSDAGVRPDADPGARARARPRAGAAGGGSASTGIGGGVAAAAAVVAEKDRENAVRRQIRAFDRWDWPETLRRTPLESRLIAMGVPRVRRARRLFGAADASAALPPRPRRPRGSTPRSE